MELTTKYDKLVINNINKCKSVYELNEFKEKYTKNDLIIKFIQNREKAILKELNLKITKIQILTLIQKIENELKEKRLQELNDDNLNNINNDIAKLIKLKNGSYIFSNYEIDELQKMKEKINETKLEYFLNLIENEVSLKMKKLVKQIFDKSENLIFI